MSSDNGLKKFLMIVKFRDLYLFLNVRNLCSQVLNLYEYIFNGVLHINF